MAGHTDEVYWLQFSEDGRRLLSHGKDRSLREWDLESGTSRVVVSDVGAPLAAADFEVVAVLSRGAIELIDVKTGARTEVSPGDAIEGKERLSWAARYTIHDDPPVHSSHLFNLPLRP